MGNFLKNKSLMVVLGCLVFLIIGLTVAIIVVNSRNAMNGCEGAVGEECLSGGDEAEDDSELIVLTEEEQAIIDASEEEMEKWSEKYESFENDVASVRNEAKKYLEQTPVDFDAIHGLYSELEEKYKKSDDLSFVVSLMFDERNLFLEYEKKEEALRGLTLNDYSIFAEWDQHDYYGKILDLANELGNEDVVMEYQPLFDATQAAWDENMNKIENATTE